MCVCANTCILVDINLYIYINTYMSIYIYIHMNFKEFISI